MSETTPGGELVTAAPAGVVMFDPSLAASLLGIDEAVVNAAYEEAAELAAASTFANKFRVDTDGMTNFKYSNLGQFNPVEPGAEKPKTMMDTVTIIPLNTVFYSARYLEELKADKDGKQEKKNTLDCETAKRILVPGTPATDDTPEVPAQYMYGTPDKDGKKDLINYFPVPMFGHAKTVSAYATVGTKHGVCTTCPFTADKTCKDYGIIVALVVQHDNVDLARPYIAFFRANYTSGIGLRKTLDNEKKTHNTDDPRNYVIRIGLEKNEVAVNPFWEFTYDVRAKRDAVPAATMNTWLTNALTDLQANKAAVKAKRQAKQVTAGNVPAALAAGAEPPPF